MSFIGTTDFFMEVAQGNIPGMSQVNKFGENGDVAQNTTEDIWDGGGTYPYPASATITHVSEVSHDANDVNMTIEVQGLDTDWALTVQTVDLHATNTSTEVALGTPLRRIFRMKVLESIVAGENIEAHVTGGATVYAIIQAGNNQTLMSIYTIPAGKTGYVVKFYAALAASAVRDPDSVLIRSWARDNTNGYAFQLKHSLNLDKGGTTAFERNFGIPLRMPEKTDLRMTAYADGADAFVSSGFDIVLIDD